MIFNTAIKTRHPLGDKYDYLLNTETERAALPVRQPVGASAYVIESGKTYQYRDGAWHCDFIAAAAGGSDDEVVVLELADGVYSSNVLSTSTSYPLDDEMKAFIAAVADDKIAVIKFTNLTYQEYDENSMSYVTHSNVTRYALIDKLYNSTTSGTYMNTTLKLPVFIEDADEFVEYLEELGYL